MKDLLSLNIKYARCINIYTPLNFATYGQPYLGSSPRYTQNRQSMKNSNSKV